MCGGEVYVDGVPLRDTTIGLAAPVPPPRVPLAEAMWQADPGLTIHDVGLDHELTLDAAGAPNAYVVDCVSGEDLDRIVRSTLPHANDIVLAGASGLAEALAGQIGGVPKRKFKARAGTGLTLIVVGSRSLQSATQVDAMRSVADAVVLPAPGGKLDVDKALNAVAARGGALATLVVHAQPPASGLDVDHSTVSRSLASLALALLARLDVGALVLIGGDTTHAVLEALGARAINVLGQLMPNVAVGAIPCAGRQLPVIAKEGDFGDERFLLDVAGLLRERGSPARSRRLEAKRRPDRASVPRAPPEHNDHSAVCRRDCPGRALNSPIRNEGECHGRHATQGRLLLRDGSRHAGPRCEDYGGARRRRRQPAGILRIPQRSPRAARSGAGGFRQAQARREEARPRSRPRRQGSSIRAKTGSGR
jgi:hypothetical protein